MATSTAPASGFSPVVTRSAAAQVADQIVAAIRDGHVPQHGRLPAERDLAKQLGVSRPTLREALAALELAGLIESRQGHGSVVVAAAGQVAGWGVELTPTQVFEARLAVEPELARLAAAKRFPDDLVALREAGDRVEREYAATGAYDSDLEVHRAVAAAARNPILADALEAALKPTRTARWAELREQALARPEHRKGHVFEIRRVIDHIEAGEGAQAAKVWSAHLEFYRDEMLRGLRPDPAG